MRAALSRLITHRLSLRALGLLIGGVLIWASLDKLTHPDRFADIVREYDMLPAVLVNAFALVMPWAEAVTGAALVIGVWRRGAGLLSTVLFAAFMIAIAQALLRGLKVEDCGCFDVSGMSASAAGWDLFVRDAGMLLASVVVWRRG